MQAGLRNSEVLRDLTQQGFGPRATAITSAASPAGMAFGPRADPSSKVNPDTPGGNQTGGDPTRLTACDVGSAFLVGVSVILV